jgi:hypothetical protein
MLNRNQKTEIRRQKSGNRRQKSGDRNQGTGNRRQSSINIIVGSERSYFKNYISSNSI